MHSLQDIQARFFRPPWTVVRLDGAWGMGSGGLRWQVCPLAWSWKLTISVRSTIYRILCKHAAHSLGGSTLEAGHT